MSKEFWKEFEALWSHIDPNGHMRHTAYSDYATNVRVSFLEEIGLEIQDLNTLAIGPIILREFIEYRREILLQDKFKIDLQLAGASPDGIHWRIRHNIYRSSDAKLCCSILMEGSWIDFKTRKMCALPPELSEKFLAIKKTDDFKTLERRSSMKLEG